MHDSNTFLSIYFPIVFQISTMNPQISPLGAYLSIGFLHGSWLKGGPKKVPWKLLKF